jgi:general L-amino acid transport system substrate-binding protein
MTAQGALPWCSLFRVMSGIYFIGFRNEVETTAVACLLSERLAANGWRVLCINCFALIYRSSDLDPGDPAGYLDSPAFVPMNPDRRETRKRSAFMTKPEMKGRLGVAAGAVAIVMTTAMAASAVQASTLQAVKDRGFLQCGVTTGLAGFSMPDERGNWTGIDVDTCRGMAAAIFGDANAIRFTPLSARERFTALQSGEIDVLSRNTTWTLVRDASLGLNFTGVNYYDGQGFMVRESLGVSSPMELDGATFCIQSGTTTELNLADFFRTNGMQYDALVFDTSDQTGQAFAADRCDVLTSDISQLAALRSRLDDPSSAVLLPQLISKEPLGPVVRQGDDQFFNVIKWSLKAQINAEELGVNSGNVDEMLSSDNPEIQRLLGTNGNDMGQPLGLEANWAYNILKQVGNYGEMFENNVGPNTPLGLPRGMNALWNQGGILYAPPIR